MLVLALENSTSSVKALLYDSDEGVVAKETIRYPSSLKREGQIDTEGAYQMLLEAGRRVAGGEKVEAIAVCGTWHSLAVCDSKMQPLTPTYTWEFLGATELCRKIRSDEEKTNIFYQRTGCMPNVTYPRHALDLLRSEGMSFANKQIISQGAYAFYRMTDVFCESISTQCGSGLINIHELVYDEFVLSWLGLKSNQLGQLVTYQDIQLLNNEAAKELGIQAGVPVVPAHPDGALNQLGNGATVTDIMTMSVGTSGALRVVADRPILPGNRELWCYYGVNTWISGAAISGACNCINWFCDTYLHGTKRPAEMDALAEDCYDVPIFLPFLYGERCPGWDDARKGVFHDVLPSHELASFYKAVEMGVVFNLLQCYEIMCKLNGVPEKVILSGGILHSQQWMQILADTFSRDFVISANADASLSGAIALALYAAGCISNFDEFSGFNSEQISVLRPRKEVESFYSNKYQRYLELY